MSCILALYLRLRLSPLIAAFVCLTVPALAEKRIDDATITPRAIYQDEQPATVKVAVRVGRDAALVKDSIALVQRDALDREVRVLAQLWDDGTHGDDTAGDSIYSAEILLNEPAPTVMFLVISASYSDSDQRLSKRQGNLAVQLRQTCQEALGEIAAAFEKGEMQVAKAFFTSVQVDEILDALPPEGRIDMARFLRTATLSTSSSQRCDFKPPADDPSNSRLPITLQKGPLGNWRITDW